MTNPQFLHHSTPPDLSREVVEIESSPPAIQSASTQQFSQLDKTSETAHQQSILQFKQKRSEQSHAESVALSTCSKLSTNSQLQLISQIFAVNIYAYYDIIYDLDLHLCNEWASIH